MGGLEAVRSPTGLSGLGSSKRPVDVDLRRDRDVHREAGRLQRHLGPGLERTILALLLVAESDLDQTDPTEVLEAFVHHLAKRTEVLVRRGPEAEHGELEAGQDRVGLGRGRLQLVPELDRVRRSLALPSGGGHHKHDRIV